MSQTYRFHDWIASNTAQTIIEGSNPFVERCRICKQDFKTHAGWEKHRESKKHAATILKLFKGSYFYSKPSSTPPKKRLKGRIVEQSCERGPHCEKNRF